MNAYQDLKTEIKNCNKCRLADTQTQSLCGEGSLHAGLMLIAQAPGENEDREGRMFMVMFWRVMVKK